MKLQTQVLSIGVAGGLLAGLVGAIGLASSFRMAHAVEGALDSGAALQASQEADMMHDALRGDAQLAVLGAMQHNAERQAEAERGLKEHVETFSGALDKLGKLPLNDDARAQLTVVRPLVAQYIDEAGKMVAAAKANPEQADARGPAFQQSFEKLEGEMAKLSESLERNGEALNGQAQSSVQQTLWSIAVALVVAASVMIAWAWWQAQRMVGPMRAAVDAADRLAQGDMTCQLQPVGNDETVQLLQSLGRMKEQVAAMVRDVKDNAERVAVASAEIAMGNNDLSARTEQQSSSLERTASSMTQLGSTVRQNADNASQANQLALSATRVAEEGGQVVSQVVDTMRGINESSRKISDIIGVIDGIAFQTNILALNAAVEAARAGEQGRGFAVVASEVRSLAGRSAEAAREIKTLIGASVDRVEQGSQLVNQAGDTMSEVVNAIRRVTDIVAEITVASAEQANGVDMMGQAVSEMDQATQQNAALVEQSAAASDSLRQQATQLVQAVSAFRVQA